jgi:hypothetical protein
MSPPARTLKSLADVPRCFSVRFFQRPEDRLSARTRTFSVCRPASARDDAAAPGMDARADAALAVSSSKQAAVHILALIPHLNVRQQITRTVLKGRPTVNESRMVGRRGLLRFGVVLTPWAELDNGRGIERSRRDSRRLSDAPRVRDHQPRTSDQFVPDGLDAVDGYRSRSADPSEVVPEPPLSAGLVPPDGCWRTEAPYLAQTRRLLTDPTSALPWHPMVLHRGGWPDGS